MALDLQSSKIKQCLLLIPQMMGIVSIRDYDFLLTLRVLYRRGIP